MFNFHYYQYILWYFILHGFNHEKIEPVIIVGGHLINELINKIIKVSIKSPRPDFHKISVVMVVHMV